MKGIIATREKNEEEKGQYKYKVKDICDGLEIQKSDSPAHIVYCKMYVEICGMQVKNAQEREPGIVGICVRQVQRTEKMTIDYEVVKRWSHGQY